MPPHAMQATAAEAEAVVALQQQPPAVPVVPQQQAAYPPPAPPSQVQSQAPSLMPLDPLAVAAAGNNAAGNNANATHANAPFAAPSAAAAPVRPPPKPSLLFEAVRRNMISQDEAVLLQKTLAEAKVRL
jgi:hypothetical protein